MSVSPRKSRRLPKMWLSILSIVGFFAAWQAIASAQVVPALFLPTLPSVLEALRAGAADGTLFVDIGVSLFRAFAGLLVALVIGVLAGFAMARVRIVRWFCDPVISVLFPAPKIAFLPVVILWFGIDHTSKIMIVAVSCVFPIAIAAYEAARSINPFLVWSALSLGASRAKVQWAIVLPACGPSLFAALRVAVPVALIMAFTSEMVAGGGGMGATLMYSQRFFESPTVFAYILAMLVVGVLMDRGLLAIQRFTPSLSDQV